MRLPRIEDRRLACEITVVLALKVAALVIIHNAFFSEDTTPVLDRDAIANQLAPHPFPASTIGHPRR